MHVAKQDGDDSETNSRPVSQITAWRQPDSLHWTLMRAERENEIKKKAKEELDKKNCLILGLADLSSKNSARDFAERANEKSKSKMILNDGLRRIADQDAALKQDLEKNRTQFHAEFEEFDKKMKKYDR